MQRARDMDAIRVKLHRLDEKADDGGPLYRATVDADSVDALDGAAVTMRIVVDAAGDVVDAEGERHEAGAEGWSTLLGEAYKAASDDAVSYAVREALRRLRAPRDRDVFTRAMLDCLRAGDG